MQSRLGRDCYLMLHSTLIQSFALRTLPNLSPSQWAHLIMLLPLLEVLCNTLGMAMTSKFRQVCTWCAQAERHDILFINACQ